MVLLLSAAPLLSVSLLCTPTTAWLDYLEELLQQVPITLFPLDAGDVLKGVHLNIVRKVSGKQFCHQKAISEVPEAHNEPSKDL